MFHARVLIVVFCLSGPVAMGQDAPAPAVPEVEAAEAPSEDASFALVAELMGAVKKAGMPKEMTIVGIATYAGYVVILVVLGYGAYRMRDNADMKQFLLDAGAAADHVYIAKIEGADGKLDGKAARDAGMLFLSDMKGPTARIIAKKGKPWVMSQIHRIANRKKKEGTDLKISKAAAAPAAA